MTIDPVAVLTQINLDDLVNAFGVERVRLPARAIRLIFRRAARDFASQMVEFDRMIGERGLAEAACVTERLFVRDVRLFGADRLPDGPCIYLANHPGLTDTLALFAALAQPDLRIIALDRPFLLALPNLARQLYFVTDDAQERVSLVRRVHRHLKSGGSVLTFPAGHTEPDPAVYPRFIESLSSWTDSVGVFVRFAPDTPIVPLSVRAVTSRVVAENPLVRLRQTPDDRQLLASALQLLSNVVLHSRPVTVQIRVGEPIRASTLGSTKSEVLHAAVLASMRNLLQPPQGQGVSVL